MKGTTKADPEHEAILRAITKLTRTVLSGQQTARMAHEDDDKTLKLMLEKMNDLSTKLERLEYRLSALEEWKRRHEIPPTID